METGMNDERRKLTAEDRAAIYERFVNRKDGDTVTAIAKEFGISRLWVRTIVKRLRGPEQAA